MPADQPHAPTGSLQPRAVRRALDAMHANVGHRWTITELASVAGTSGRTLQRQFLSFLGKTPHAVLLELFTNQGTGTLIHK